MTLELLVTSVERDRDTELPAKQLMAQALDTVSTSTVIMHC